MRALQPWNDGIGCVIIVDFDGGCDGSAGVYGHLSDALDYIADWLAAADYGNVDTIRKAITVKEIPEGWIASFQKIQYRIVTSRFRV